MDRESGNKQEGQNAACVILKEQKNAAFGHHCDMRHRKSINLGWIHRNCHSIAQIECGQFPWDFKNNPQATIGSSTDQHTQTLTQNNSAGPQSNTQKKIRHTPQLKCYQIVRFLVNYPQKHCSPFQKDPCRESKMTQRGKEKLKHKKDLKPL